MSDNIHRAAVISKCGTYRYTLTRTWDTEKDRVAFVMLNPSTADAEVDDPTITRCIGFAKDWGYGGLYVVNLYAYRATDPADLTVAFRTGGDIIGPENLEYLHQVAIVSGEIIVAWGAGTVYSPAHIIKVLDLLPGAKCLGTTKYGAPRHPLYMAKDSVLTLYTGKGY